MVFKEYEKQHSSYHLLSSENLTLKVRFCSKTVRFNEDSIQTSDYKSSRLYLFFMNPK